jgi:hypothetical protein
MSDDLRPKRMRMTAKEIAAVENAIANARHRVREAMLAESTVFRDGIDRLVLALYAAEEEIERLRKERHRG